MRIGSSLVLTTLVALAAVTGSACRDMQTSLQSASALCVAEHGEGFRMAEFHDGGGGWNWWARGELPTSTRFWVHINDQRANPWNTGR